jgi:hypothetical protein
VTDAWEDPRDGENDDIWEDPRELGDRKEQARKKREKLIRNRFREALRNSLKKDYMRLVFQRIIRRAGWYEDLVSESPARQDRRLGKRQLVIWLREEIAAIDPGYLQAMEAEWDATMSTPEQMDAPGDDERRIEVRP